MKNIDVVNKMKKLNLMVAQDIFYSERNKKDIPTPTQMRILDYLIEHQKEEVYQRDFEEVLGISRATISNVLRTMERSDLIERVTSKKDSRVKQIILKDKAKNIFEKNHIKLEDISQTLFKDISKDEINKLNEIIDKMINNLKERGE